MSAAGTVRTLCVRTCDGYYFPISFSTTRKHLAADEAACQRACPAAEALVYYHRAAGEGPEQMVSISGSRYTDLPAAFSYRTALNPSCSCGKPGDGLLNATAKVTSQQRPVPALLPRPRPAPGEDPETLANRAGGLMPRFKQRFLAVNEQGVRSGVRVVGVHDVLQFPVSPVPNDGENGLLRSSKP